PRPPAPRAGRHGSPTPPPAMPPPMRADGTRQRQSFSRRPPMTIDIVHVRIVPVPRSGRFRTVLLGATMILLAASVAGCSKKVARTPDPRPVRTVTVDSRADGETVSFTGQIRAKD